MMNDTVREDLQSLIKVSSAVRPRFETLAEKPAEMRPAPLPISLPSLPSRPLIAAAPPRKRDTANLMVSRTSPTLVGFQNKAASLPDWRIQLQNSVQRRKGGVETEAAVEKQFPVNGSAALKVEIVQRPEPVVAPQISDPRVANAMRRIEESRKTFLEAPAKAAKPSNVRAFGVAAGATAIATIPAKVNIPQKPVLFAPRPLEFKRDTNKLPSLPKVQETAIRAVEPKIERVEKLDNDRLDAEFADIKRIRINTEHVDASEIKTAQNEANEIEDLAPFSMRFAAGLFDLIIGGFASLVLLSPVVFTSGNWVSLSGILMMLATFSLVMFGYMTTCLGFFGKTLGMRLFSLELVDAVENEYPTLKQAAVNSSVFIVSMCFGGAGFLTVLFNEEKRAAHDLLSGTILVREF